MREPIMDDAGLVIRPFDVRGAPEDEYLAMWAHCMSGIREVMPELSGVPADEWIRQARTEYPKTEISVWAIWDPSGAGIVGSGRVMAENSGHDTTGAVVQISVEPRHRRKGLAGSLLGLATDRAEEWGRSVLRIQTNDRCPAGALFMERLGARVLFESHTNRLLPGNVDRGLLDRWMELPTDRSHGIEIEEWGEEAPEGLVNTLCALFQEVYDAQPRLEGFEMRHHVFTPEKLREGERLSRERGIRPLVLGACSRTADRMVGFTSICWRPSQPGLVSQNYTAVLPAFRRMGVAKRLKAEMLARVLRDMPQVESVITGNDDTNEPILRINRELGFEPYVARANWVVEIPAVREYLRRRGDRTGSSVDEGRPDITEAM